MAGQLPWTVAQPPPFPLLGLKLGRAPTSRTRPWARRYATWMPNHSAGFRQASNKGWDNAPHQLSSVCKSTSADTCMTTILTAQRPDSNRLSTDIMSDDYTQEEMWSSPVQADRPRTPRTPKTPKTPTQEREPIDHEAALRKELEGVRNINESIEGVIATLERAGGNMDVCAGSVPAATSTDFYRPYLKQ